MMHTPRQQSKIVRLLVFAVLLGWCLSVSLAQPARGAGRVEAGDAYEHLQGVFGLRLRVVRLQLGDESIVLSEYLAPKGRPAPIEARSNDRWFQHIVIIVNDMDRAYQRTIAGTKWVAPAIIGDIGS